MVEAEGRGEKGFGKSLPLREVSTDDGVTVRVHFVGPVREGGRDERLAYYDIKVGFYLPDIPALDPQKISIRATARLTVPARPNPPRSGPPKPPQGQQIDHLTV